MTKNKAVFTIAITAMNNNELFEFVSNDKVTKPDFDVAVRLFVRNSPKDFKEQLKSLAEDEDQNIKVRSRVILFLVQEGYADNEYPDELIEELKEE